MEHQQWGDSYVTPKNTGDKGKQNYNTALDGNVEAVTKGTLPSSKISSPTK
jgi:hypothetical protein